MKLKSILIILLSCLTMTAFAQQKKVAVYVTGEDASINKVLSSKLISAIARSEQYTAIERTEAILAELGKELNYQQTGAVDDNELSRLGKQFGVQYVCVASVIQALGEKYISARLINVETAQVERSASTNGNIISLDGIIAAANELSRDLLSNLENEREKNVKKVAVYVVRSDAGKDIERVLGDKLVAGFTNSKRYVAIERTNSFLSQLNKEQEYQRTGVVDDQDISRLGRQFGVQYVCVADVTEVFGKKFITARLIDVETAEAVNAFEKAGQLRTMKECLKIANEIASNLSKGTFAEQQAEEAQIKSSLEQDKNTIAELKNSAMKLDEQVKSYKNEYPKIVADYKKEGISFKNSKEDDIQKWNNVIVIQNSYLHLIDLMQQMDERTQNILLLSTDDKNIAKSYQEISKTWDMSGEIADRVKRIESILVFQNHCVNFIVKRKTITEKINEINTGSGKDYSDIAKSFADFQKGYDLTLTIDTNDNHSRLNEFIVIQDNCLAFIELRKTIAQNNIKIADYSKTAPSIVKSYNTYMKGIDLTWNYESDKSEALSDIITMQIALIDALSNPNIGEIDKVVKKMKDKSWENVKKEVLK